jgi:putative SOS response-associated peptidase YedK
MAARAAIFFRPYNDAMCANYTPTRRDLLPPQFGVAPPDDAYPEEAYPGAPAPFIRTVRGSARCDVGMFGLVPPWADTKLARSTYNARSETVATKPSFRDAWKRRQFCLIPAQNIYEPCYESGKAVRWEIGEADGAQLALAGLWTEKPDGPDGLPLLSFTMLTINADAHALMRRMHRPEDEKRMVVALRPEQYGAWIAGALAGTDDFLLPYPAEALVAKAAPRTVAKAATAKPEPRPAPVQGGLFD